MDSDRRLGQAISRWLEETAPPRLPDRVLQATFERTRGTRQQVGWRARLGRLRMTPALPALGGAVVVVAAAVALNAFVNPPRVAGPAVTADPRIPLVGTWRTTDADGSTPTMTIRTSGEDTLEILVTDDVASVCSYRASTMTGTGRLRSPETLVIPSPTITCDDGSEPRAVSGPPLADQLRDLTFVHDRGADTLGDSLGGTWAREGARLPSPQPTIAQAVWPQTSLAEVAEAQRRADAGDPAYTWQVDPELADGRFDDAEILARFLREQLGWAGFRAVGGGIGEGYHVSVVRCAPGRTNPLYPNDPRGGGCAPTIDDLRYEQVGIDLHQPIRQDPTGIWVVSGWEAREPFEQVVPPSEAEMTALVGAFLGARIAGQGAEPFVNVDDMGLPSREVPLLYATSRGSAYERGEFDVLEGPIWVSGWTRLRVRLFADGGATVVEQKFDLVPPIEAGRVSLHYVYQWDGAPTTENGTPVPVEYGFIPSEVTFRAAWPWYREVNEEQAPRLVILVTYHDVPSLYEARLAVVADPHPIDRGCDEGPAPADAEALARAIQADPDLEVTAPVAVTIGGRPALQMDIDQAPGASLCENWGQAAAVTAGIVGESSRMRLWLLDLPGPTVRMLAIALTTSKADFGRVVAAEAPMLATFAFKAP